MGQEQFDSRSIAGGVDLRIIMIMSNIMMTTITKIMIMMTIIVRMMMMITMVTICSQAGRLVGSSVTQELVFWSHDNSPSFDPRTNDEENEDQRGWLSWRWSGWSPEADTLPSQREPWWLLSSDLTTITMMIILIYHHYYHFNKEEKNHDNQDNYHCWSPERHPAAANCSGPTAWNASKMIQGVRFPPIALVEKEWIWNTGKMSIQCGIFIINALRFQKLFWRIFKFLCWSIAEIFHFPSQDGHNAVPLGLNCHQRLINPEWSSPHQDGFVESSCQSRSQRRKVRRWDLRPSRGRTYLQNRIIWWFDV